MIRRLKEKIDYEIPGYLNREPMDYIECTCDRCGGEVDELYELDGEQLCRECLLERTKINVEGACNE